MFKTNKHYDGSKQVWFSSLKQRRWRPRYNTEYTHPPLCQQHCLLATVLPSNSRTSTAEQRGHHLCPSVCGISNLWLKPAASKEHKPLELLLELLKLLRLRHRPLDLPALIHILINTPHHICLLAKGLQRVPVLSQAPQRFLEVAVITLREFYSAISRGEDRDPSWKKVIYKVICKLDCDVPAEFKSQRLGWGTSRGVCATVVSVTVWTY